MGNMNDTAPKFKIRSFEVKSQHVGGTKTYRVFTNSGLFAHHLAKHILDDKERLLWEQYFGLKEDFWNELAPRVKKYRNYSGPNVDADDVSLIEKAYEYLVEKLEKDVRFAVAEPVLAKLEEKPINKGKDAKNLKTTIFPGRAGVLGFENKGFLRTFFFPNLMQVTIEELLDTCHLKVMAYIDNANAHKVRKPKDTPPINYKGICGTFVTDENREHLISILEQWTRKCLQTETDDMDL